MRIARAWPTNVMMRSGFGGEQPGEWTPSAGPAPGRRGWMGPRGAGGDPDTGVQPVSRVPATEMRDVIEMQGEISKTLLINIQILYFKSDELDA